MTSRVCPSCGAIVPRSVYREHRAKAHTRTGPNGWSDRDKAAHMRFARAVKQRDHHRCQQCGTNEQLVAHHIQSLAQGGTDNPTNGITLCTTCHRGGGHPSQTKPAAVTPHQVARARRVQDFSGVR